MEIGLPEKHPCCANTSDTAPKISSLSVCVRNNPFGAPFALPYSFGLCQRYVDSMVVVPEVEIRRAMGLLFQRMKIAVEPACAAPAAALLGPLRDSLAGQRVALVFCGSNIDWDSWYKYAMFD